jgi:mono/diheme cytochrome c family protein
VLGTWFFAAFWLLLGLGVFFIAVRGGLRGTRATLQSQTHGARRLAAVSFTTIYFAFGIALPVIFLVGNHVNTNRQFAGMNLTAAEKRGQVIFANHCGVCHTLAAASTNGKVGPNLDVIKPTETLVLHTINNGCLQQPAPSESAQTCLGLGTMPAGIVAGEQAQQVAKFVSAVAGRA